MTKKPVMCSVMLQSAVVPCPVVRYNRVLLYHMLKISAWRISCLMQQVLIEVNGV